MVYHVTVAFFVSSRVFPKMLSGLVGSVFRHAWVFFEEDLVQARDRLMPELKWSPTHFTCNIQDTLGRDFWCACELSLNSVFSLK